MEPPDDWTIGRLYPLLRELAASELSKSGVARRFVRPESGRYGVGLIRSRLGTGGRRWFSDYRRLGLLRDGRRELVGSRSVDR